MKLPQYPPLNTFLQRCLYSNVFSPDAVELTSGSSYVPVFVYGCEKAGMSEHEILHGAKRKGRGWMINPQYKMYWYQSQPTARREPVILKRPNDPTAARIQGELYVVKPDILFELDRLYENTLYFQRANKTIQYYLEEDRDKTDRKTFIADAWVFEGKSAQWQDRWLKGELNEVSIIDADKPYYIWRSVNDRHNFDITVPK
jgi:gamma-glutamylcyclotransferase (GGCT)/AIG2-like uncharacterized protein YtfP